MAARKSLLLSLRIWSFAHIKQTNQITSGHLKMYDNRKSFKLLRVTSYLLYVKVDIVQSCSLTHLSSVWHFQGRWTVQDDSKQPEIEEIPTRFQVHTNKTRSVWIAFKIGYNIIKAKNYICKILVEDKAFWNP